jgi:hypothetical protein
MFDRLPKVSCSRRAGAPATKWLSRKSLSLLIKTIPFASANAATAESLVSEPSRILFTWVASTPRSRSWFDRTTPGYPAEFRQAQRQSGAVLEDGPQSCESASAIRSFRNKLTSVSSLMPRRSARIRIFV